jgi:ferredoxin-thioredoxin reductase catalytic subunit
MEPLSGIASALCCGSSMADTISADYKAAIGQCLAWTLQRATRINAKVAISLASALSRTFHPTKQTKTAETLAPHCACFKQQDKKANTELRWLLHVCPVSFTDATANQTLSCFCETY